MFAFYEAIKNYSRLRGSFLKFAALQIKNRLIDNYRKEKRNKGQISLDVNDDDKTDLKETIRDEHDDYAENELRDATKQEIETFDSGSGRKSLIIIDYARKNPEILDDFLRTKRVPLAKLAEGANVERKSLERHRRYLVAVLLICTNGYEIMRGHIMQVLKGGENK